jgi:hypothetical protein
VTGFTRGRRQFESCNIVLVHQFHTLSAPRRDRGVEFPSARASQAGWRPFYPHRLLTFATLGLCDFVLTCIILSLGGEECNAIALWLFENTGLGGAAAYKFGLIAGVICLVEWIARHDRAAGLRLANYSLILGSVPVVVGSGLLMIHFFNL